MASGLGYRAYFQELNRAPDRTVFPRETLNKHFPLEVAGWTGRDQPLSEQIVQAADIDDYLQRVYTRGTSSVTLYVAAGVRARDLVPHRPDVCYRTHGWTQRKREDVVLDLPGDKKLAAKLYEFTPAKLNGENIRVLNYYYVDGESCPDVELLRSKARQGQSALRYMTQVQLLVTFRESETPGQSLALLREFAQVTALPILEILERESAVAETARAISQQGPTHHAG